MKARAIARTVLIWLAVAGSTIVVLVLGASAVFVYWSFYAKLGDVQRLLSEASPAELSPPEVVRLAVDLASEKNWEWQASLTVTRKIFEAPVRLRAWHVHGLVWQALLPRHFSREELLAMYLHLRPYEAGRGLVGAANYYFSVSPSDLSLEQAVGLEVIARSPRHYSPKEHPEQYRKAVQELLARK
jgi:hypothetical protein